MSLQHSFRQAKSLNDVIENTEPKEDEIYREGDMTFMNENNFRKDNDMIER